MMKIWKNHCDYDDSDLWWWWWLKVMMIMIDGDDDEWLYCKYCVSTCTDVLCSVHCNICDLLKDDNV